MNALKSLVCAGVVGTGALLGVPQEADAGGFAISIGRGGYYGGYGGYGNYGYGGYGGFVGRGYGHGGYYPHYGHGHGHNVWHDTSHWDYTPGAYVPHGNHYHYIPGHYDWHQDGHWDHYHH